MQDRESWRTVCVALFTCSLAISVASASPNGDYSLPLSSSAAEPGVDAVIRFHACGHEKDPVLKAFARDNTSADQKVAGEDLLGVLVAKILFLRRIESSRGCAIGEWNEALRQPLQDGSELDLRTSLDNSFPIPNGSCTDILNNVLYVTRECLVEQINVLLAKSAVVGEPGSAGLPCIPPTVVGTGINFLTVGEWDVSVRELTRIAFLDRDRSVLAFNVRKHLDETLLSLSGGSSTESYQPTECGNRTQISGSPEERAEEFDFLNNLFPDIGDIWDWLTRWLRNPFQIPAAAGPALFGPLWPAISNAAPGLLSFSFLSIPESENHLLMINSGAFLKNQMDLEVLSNSHPGKPFWMLQQQEVREWLLLRLQRIAREDFREYNARPYTRYSLSALRNLVDFSKDPAVRMAAQNVLDLTFAKAALGSSDNRRFVPFRRRMEAIPNVIEANKLGNGLFDLGSPSDHVIASMLVYTANWSQTPRPGHAATAATKSMLYAAASDYRPPSSVVELAHTPAITPSFQRVRHAGAEVYFRNPAFLVTGGGVRTPPADSLQIMGTSTGGGGIGPIPFAPPEGYGAALPTTLILHGTRQPWSSLEDFLRIDGPYMSVSSENKTHDHNLCVWEGFACGYFIRIPSIVAACMTPSVENGWRFFDSDRCTSQLIEGRRVFAAVYQESCGAECDMGFFDAVQAQPPFDFEAFKSRIVEDNKLRQPTWRTMVDGVPALQGEYASAQAGSPVIQFSTRAHQRDEQASGIEAVNGNVQPRLSAWRRLDGFLSSDDGTRFTFRHPDLPARGFDFDMSDHRNPKRVVLP